MREVFVFVAFTALLVFFVASLAVLGIVVQLAGRTVLPTSREHDRELLRRAHGSFESRPIFSRGTCRRVNTFQASLV